MSRRALILLDRDGVLNEDSPDYVRSLDDLHLIQGAPEAVARLSRAGHPVFVVTNQSGVGRGLIAPDALARIHDEIAAHVGRLGGRIDGFALCPHLPDDGCGCRKPGTAMIEAVRARLSRSDASPSETFLVGDRATDLEAARAAGCRAILVRTGHGRQTERALAPDAGVEVFDDLAAAADWLLGD
jgi:D-glycero-D-manno-heptose 1,7-bisphosphate phosphatase